MAQAKVTPISAINNFNPNGSVPFRTYGDVGRLLACYPEITTKWQKIKLPRFHRYFLNDRILSFDSDETAAKGLEEAERGLRLQPAPGINRNSPIGRVPQEGEVTVFSVDTLGHVLSHWDEESRSIINETLPDHAYRDGFVIRQASVVSRTVWITTFGEGQNDTQFKAWNNGTNGPLGFLGCDDVIRRRLESLPGVRQDLSLFFLAM